MRPLIAVATIMLCLGGLTVGAFAAYTPIDVSDWGTWTGHTFTLGGTRNIEWATTWGAENNQITSTKLPPLPWSGGEAYDTEGLYLDVVTRADSHTYLEWLMITSYTGLEAPGDANGEWMYTAGWDGSPGGAGTVSRNTGYYAGIREGNNNQSWKYRSNPVIGISLAPPPGLPPGLPRNNPASTNYEWGLILDSTEGVNGIGPQGGTPYDVTTSASLYYLSATQQTTKWKQSPGAEFPLAGPADLNTIGLTPLITGTTGGLANYSMKTFAGQNETSGQQMANNWKMPYNWYWTGRMDITGLAPGNNGSLPEFSISGANPSSQVHYSPWCSNDYVFIDRPGGTFIETETPELSSGALLLLGMLPVGLGWLKRRKVA